MKLLLTIIFTVFTVIVTICGLPFAIIAAVTDFVTRIFAMWWDAVKNGIYRDTNKISKEESEEETQVDEEPNDSVFVDMGV